VCLGTSGDTPAFAVDTISAWWQTEGRAAYPKADHLLRLADAGGSNGFQIRAWKERLQVQFCDRFGLTVTVCHYLREASACSEPVLVRPQRRVEIARLLLVVDEIPKHERDRVRRDPLDYCHRDALTMIRLLETLEGLARVAP
jgi:Rhodopirellula transposase DDE domain